MANPTDLAQLLRVTLGRAGTCAASYREREGFAPSPRSRAERDQQENAALSHSSSMWGPKPVTSAYTMAWVGLYACEDHMGGMQRMLDYPPQTYALVALARAQVESACRAWYLLDPAIDPRGRVERAMTERLHGLHQQTKYPSALGASTATRDRIDSLLEGARSLGFSVQEPNRRAPYLGTPRPTFTRLIEDMLPDVGEVLYRFFSGIAHAQPGDLLRFGIMQGSETVIGGVDVVRVGLQPNDALQVVSATLLGFSAAFSRMIDAYGWDRKPWDEITHFSLRKLDPAIKAFAPST
jgi:hypothetical protein